MIYSAELDRWYAEANWVDARHDECQKRIRLLIEELRDKRTTTAVLAEYSRRYGMTGDGDGRLTFAFWRFVHNTLIHPCFGLGLSPRWLERAHDWTAQRCWGAG